MLLLSYALSRPFAVAAGLVVAAQGSRRDASAGPVDTVSAGVPGSAEPSDSALGTIAADTRRELARD